MYLCGRLILVPQPRGHCCDLPMHEQQSHAVVSTRVPECCLVPAAVYPVAR